MLITYSCLGVALYLQVVAGSNPIKGKEKANLSQKPEAKRLSSQRSISSSKSGEEFWKKYADYIIQHTSLYKTQLYVAIKKERQRFDSEAPKLLDKILKDKKREIESSRKGFSEEKLNRYISESLASKKHAFDVKDADAILDERVENVESALLKQERTEFYRAVAPQVLDARTMEFCESKEIGDYLGGKYMCCGTSAQTQMYVNKMMEIGDVIKNKLSLPSNMKFSCEASIILHTGRIRCGREWLSGMLEVGICAQNVRNWKKEPTYLKIITFQRKESDGKVTNEYLVAIPNGVFDVIVLAL